MTALQIVTALLENDELDANLDYYLGMVQTGSVEEVLKSFGFEGSGSRWKLAIPLKFTAFRTSYGEPIVPAQMREHSYVDILIAPVGLPPTGDIQRDIFYRPDNESTGWKLQVSYQIQNCYITSSRDCIGGVGRGNVAARLNHVIRFLIEAIQVEDGKHTDLDKFFCAIDKRWGRQPNRFVVRRKTRTQRPPA